MALMLVEAGETLGIVLRYHGQETATLLHWVGSAHDRYTPGAHFFRSSSQNWAPTGFGNDDVGFRTYVTDHVATPFCFGDGVGASCPCGNESTGGGGLRQRLGIGRGPVG